MFRLAISSLVLAGVLFAAGAGLAQAQTAPGLAQAKQIEPTAIACDQVADGRLREAIAKAKELLSRFWLSHERGLFAAYTMPGEKRNPFDLTPKAADSGPRNGVVQARPPRCSTLPGVIDGAIVVRFSTAFYRFFEDGHGWSPPLRDGLLLEAVVERSGETWHTRDTGSEKSILLAEQKPRAADASRLPADKAWAEPIPGCVRRTKWNGEACVAARR